MVRVEDWKADWDLSFLWYGAAALRLACLHREGRACPEMELGSCWGLGLSVSMNAGKLEGIEI
jgi:hypothetical protein